MLRRCRWTPRALKARRRAVTQAGQRREGTRESRRPHSSRAVRCAVLTWPRLRARSAHSSAPVNRVSRADRCYSNERPQQRAAHDAYSGSANRSDRQRAEGRTTPPAQIPAGPSKSAHFPCSRARRGPTAETFVANLKRARQPPHPGRPARVAVRRVRVHRGVLQPLAPASTTDPGVPQTGAGPDQNRRQASVLRDLPRRS